MFSDSYSLIQRLLHWSIAIIVICLLAIGVVLDEVGFEGLKNSVGIDATNMIYKMHKSFGILILILMLLRIACRLLIGRPEYSEPLHPFQRIASEAVHGLFYICLIAMPILGWLATAAGGFPVEFFSTNLPGLVGKDQELSKILFEWHGIVGTALMVLIVVHVLGALYHWLALRDRVMGRMSLF